MDLQHTPTGVIVPHEAWKEYWEPLQENMNRLEFEFERYKEDKDIKVVMKVDRYTSMELEDFGSTVIGQITFEDGTSKTSVDSRAIIGSVTKFIHDHVGDSFRWLSNAKLVTLADIEPKIKQMEALRKEINATHDKVQKKIETLPRIVRWLFKIKISK